MIQFTANAKLQLPFCYIYQLNGIVKVRGNMMRFFSYYTELFFFLFIRRLHVPSPLSSKFGCFFFSFGMHIFL